MHHRVQLRLESASPQILKRLPCSFWTRFFSARRANPTLSTKTLLLLLVSFLTLHLSFTLLQKSFALDALSGNTAKPRDSTLFAALGGPAPPTHPPLNLSVLTSCSKPGRRRR